MSTYVTQPSDVGLYIRCVVTPSNTAGAGTAVPSNTLGPITSAANTAPTQTSPPVISGTATVGQTLSVTTPGVYTGNPAPTETYQWQRDTLGSAPWVNIASATGKTYVLIDADDACHVRVVGTGSNGIGTPASGNSNSIGLVKEPAPTNKTAPTLSGIPKVGSAVTSSNGSWNGMGGHTQTFAYQWKRSNGGAYSNISGATSSIYTPVTGDAGYTLECTVTATNDNGNASATSAPSVAVAAAATSYTMTIPPVISGALAVGSTLACSLPTITPTPVSIVIQWQRETSPGSGVYADIAGATGQHYTVQTSDVGLDIRPEAIVT